MTATNPQAWLSDRERIAAAATDGEWSVDPDGPAEGYAGPIITDSECCDVPELVADGTWMPNAVAIADAHNNAGKAYAALRAVLELHTKSPLYCHEDECENDSDSHNAERHVEYADFMGEYFCLDLPLKDLCRECSGADDDFDAVEWPCDTYRALTAALGEETRDDHT